MTDKIVSPSTLVDSTLPNYIVEQYERFVRFFERADESEERVGFSQDLLQNLLKYRDFDVFSKPLPETSKLMRNLSANSISQSIELDREIKTNRNESFFEETLQTDVLPIRQQLRLTASPEDDKLLLMNGDGFPDEDGVLLIGDEIILYRYREGNFCYNLERGCSGTTVLGNLTTESTYKNTVPADHYVDDEVVNLSGLFLTAMLDIIHKTFAEPIDATRVHPEINRGTLLKKIKDFFQSKGTKLGIKALFKIFFAENDVEVFYPGDRMITPSKSTWYEGMLLRLVPAPVAVSDPEYPYITPDKMIGCEMELKSYNDDNIYGRIYVDYASYYEFNDDTQYEIFVEKDKIAGNSLANPRTRLTRNLYMYGTDDDAVDVDTITVETTLGFPDSGVLIIEGEAIRYESKSFNQFFGCSRGYIGADAPHEIGTFVYGPYFYEGYITDSDGIVHASRSFPLGLVKDVNIKDQGLLHRLDDFVYPNGPGRIEPREPMLEALKENYEEWLVTVNDRVNAKEFLGNTTHGISSIYFDDDYAYVASSNLPYNPIRSFMRNTDRYGLGGEGDGNADIINIETPDKGQNVGKHMRRFRGLHAFPRRDTIKENEQIMDKGTGPIGLFVDGVPAYSNNSPYTLKQGSVNSIDVIEQGEQYITPTLVINNKKLEAKFKIRQGHIISVKPKEDVNYKNDVDARISTGEGEQLKFKYDKFGRIRDVEIVDGGKWYHDTPVLTAVDASGRGKGAVFGVQVNNGKIKSVEIVYSGIDYDPDTTYAKVVPQGEGAEIEANVQYWTFDRFFEIYHSSDWRFDKHNGGFLYEDKDKLKRDYAYINLPKPLYHRYNDEITYGEVNHSSIMGWAYDGCPIYGPYGFLNKKNADDGFIQYRSGYVLRKNRKSAIPGGGNTKATDPPLKSDYPMGSFIEDYKYSVDDAIDKLKVRKLLNSEIPQRIATHNSENIATGKFPPFIDGFPAGLLDEYNSTICNTPEFPESLYPDGVRVYFLTVDSKYKPEFPYIIGTTFAQRPLSQNINIVGFDAVDPIARLSFETYTGYDDTPLTFDYSFAERYRNPYLTSTKEELSIEVASCLDGSVSEVLVQDGAPDTNKVGDHVYFEDTASGGGADALISFVKGEDVINAEGSNIITYVISHEQIINLNSCITTTADGKEEVDVWELVFRRGTIITTPTGASAVVSRYARKDRVLYVKTFTKILIDFGDSFRDELGYLVNIPKIQRTLLDSTVPFELITENEQPIIQAQSKVIEIGTGSALVTPSNMLIESEDTKVFELFERAEKGDLDYDYEGLHTYFGLIGTDTDIEDVKAGDLWWSTQTGRLYIYFVDEDDTGSWVTTQPYATIPMEGALDEVPTNSNNAPALISVPLRENKVSISNRAPSQRANGSMMQYGDLWWSPHTAFLYMWFEDQWVCTDPNGKFPTEDALDLPNFYTPERNHPWNHIYETSQRVMISLKAPKLLPDGSPLEQGVLWWSPITGKMYIYFYDGDSIDWVITNPVAMMPNKYALDTSGTDGEGNDYVPIKPGPILPPGEDENDLLDLARRNYIWFEQLQHFFTSDKIRFYSGAPGSNVEDAKIVSIAEGGAPACAVVKRGDPLIPLLLDGTPTYNKTRYMFSVKTNGPHNIRKGDTVHIDKSVHEDLIGYHTVISAGVVEPAVAKTTVHRGKVIDVEIIDPGKYYKNDFYISFYGGGGVGGYALCEVDPLVYGGGINKITVIYGGINYRREAKIIWPEDVNNDEFSFYTDQLFGEDNKLEYSTNSKLAENEASMIEVLSGGYQFRDMPSVIGIYKKEIDRAITNITMEGTTIKKVDIEYGGSRYTNPTAVFADRTGQGYGAAADVTVTDGVVTDITVTDPGTLYVEPILTLVEADGKFISLTNDIGRLKAMDVIDPGRAISPDRSLKPELMVTTKVVLMDVTGAFNQGDVVRQGNSRIDQVTATVYSYDEERQILTLDNVEGKIKVGQNIVCEDTKVRGEVVLSGQCDARCVVEGISSPRGDFLDDTSKLSESFPVIQDSYLYQWFSYVISSPINQMRYKHVVDKVIHPSGFIMFSDLTIHSDTISPMHAEDVVFLK